MSLTCVSCDSGKAVPRAAFAGDCSLARNGITEGPPCAFAEIGCVTINTFAQSLCRRPVAYLRPWFSGRRPSFEKFASTLSKKATPKPLSRRKIVVAIGLPSGANRVSRESGILPASLQVGLFIMCRKVSVPLVLFYRHTKMCASSRWSLFRIIRMAPALQGNHAPSRIRKSCTAHKDCVRRITGWLGGLVSANYRPYNSY